MWITFQVFWSWTKALWNFCSSPRIGFQISVVYIQKSSGEAIVGLTGMINDIDVKSGGVCFGNRCKHMIYELLYDLGRGLHSCGTLQQSVKVVEGSRETYLTYFQWEQSGASKGFLSDAIEEPFLVPQRTIQSKVL